MADATSLLPIFPLPSVVLFPTVDVPLYIFEPRYRQMTAAALRDARRIGMVTIAPANVAGAATAAPCDSDPPVYRIGCEGEIRNADRHDDGTYHILLHGRQRFRILEEIPRPEDRLYRLARIEPLSETVASPGLTGQRSEILELMGRLAPDRKQHFEPALYEGVDDVRFVNAFCQAIDLQTVEKQQLLEANGVLARAEQLLSLLRFRLAERAAEASTGARTVH
jgi:Lon protease-like protein